MLCCVSRTWTGRIGVTVLFESPAVNDGDTARRTARTVGIWTGYLKGKSQRACRACLTWRAECARALTGVTGKGVGVAAVESVSPVWYSVKCKRSARNASSRLVSRSVAAQLSLPQPGA